MKKIICMITACAAVSAVIASCSSKPGKDARVIFFMGSAEVTHRDGRTEPVSLKMLLRKEDRIITRQGHVLIQIGDDILTRIDSGTTVEIARLFDNSETMLSLQHGQLISRVKKLEKNSYIIKTPTAVASVRGTAYSVSYYRNRSVLAVKEGRVHIYAAVKKETNEKMVEAGTTMVINKGQTRSINEFESLEIDRMSQIPYSSGKELEGEDVYKDIAKTAEEREQEITKEILARGGPIPRTLDEMLKKFGYLNRLTLYSNKYYTGIILSRGKKDVKIMTLDGIESVPARQVRNVKRTRSTED
ncbi:MAG: FecR domain-containing protein [Spirochaetes bacterium]|nr:FecR domain-containing protein [Spirochaetota bacterium]